jgi:hypothetical protein
VRRPDVVIVGGMEYPRSLPKAVPPDRVLVHNQVRPSRVQGNLGARYWLQVPDLDGHELKPCACEWAPELGRHFRVKLKQ